MCVRVCMLMCLRAKEGGMGREERREIRGRVRGFNE